MSDLPGEMTKQMRSQPPRIMRSRRYSLTAHGRSTPASSRLPTGSSSFEKASGWMRLPLPAAGTMPHMSRALGMGEARGRSRARRLDMALEFGEARRARVLGKHTVARGASDALLRRLVKIEGRQRLVRCANDECLRTRREKMIESVEPVGDDRRAAGGGFEQTPRGAPPIGRHVGARDVQGEPRGREERRMFRRREVA